MTDSTEARLRRVLGGDHLASLRKRLRQRFERARLDTAVESFRIGGITPEEHATLTSLLGRRRRYSKSLRVDVRVIDAALRNSGIAPSLIEALELIDGPIAHLATTRLQLRTLWSDALNNCGNPGLIGLLQAPAGMGLLKRLARQTPSAAVQLCRRAEAVLQRLPANGITRSQLAAEVLGDAHALDSGRGAATLVLAVWRHTVLRAKNQEDDSQKESTDDDDAQPSGAERDRDIWARAGVLVNELARPALFLNLPTHGKDSYKWPPGEPVYASLRLLLRSPPTWDVAGRKVYVCENPNMLAIAADRWGRNCAPLLCTDGMPAAAQRCLLAQLATARAQLCYHGDFDWPGIRIGNHVMSSHAAQPWRFSAVDYEAATQTVSGVGQTLKGTASDALWDSALSMAMEQRGISIPEEALAAYLLQDLDNR
jgi:uncharacterized protein (TIGR02679 family)